MLSVIYAEFVCLFICDSFIINAHDIFVLGLATKKTKTFLSSKKPKNVATQLEGEGLSGRATEKKKTLFFCGFPYYFALLDGMFSF